MTSDTLYVRLLRARYLTPMNHPDPAGVRHRMDDIVTDYLKEALGKTLSSPADAVWFIKRLDVDLSMNTKWPPEIAARVWADSISRAVAAIQKDGAISDNVVRFDDRAAYVAQFLVDLVDDAAWSRWYYRSFTGLKHLDKSSAVRTVLAREAETAIEGLARLPRHKIRRITDALSHADARNLFKALHPSTIGTIADLQAIWRCIEEREFYSAGWSGDRAALAVVVETVRTGDRFTYSSVWQLTRAIFTLQDIFRSGLASPALVRSAILGNNPADLYRVLTPAQSEDLMFLSGCRVEDVKEVFGALEQLSRELTQAAEPDTDTRSSDRTEVYSSRFGGVFLLLPFLDSLELNRVSHLWDDIAIDSQVAGINEIDEIDEIDAAAMLRVLILSMCLGGRSLPDILLDSAVRLVLGLSNTISLKSVMAWYENVTALQKRELCKHIVARARCLQYRAAPSPSRKLDYEYLGFGNSFAGSPGDMRSIGLAARTVLTAFANRLSGFSNSSLPYLNQNFLSCSAVVEVSDDKIVATLSRPPLDVILNMTGMSRTAYKLSWLSLQVAVFPASA